MKLRALLKSMPGRTRRPMLRRLRRRQMVVVVDEAYQLLEGAAAAPVVEPASPVIPGMLRAMLIVDEPELLGGRATGVLSTQKATPGMFRPAPVRCVDDIDVAQLYVAPAAVDSGTETRKSC